MLVASINNEMVYKSKHNFNMIYENILLQWQLAFDGYIKYQHVYIVFGGNNNSHMKPN